MICSNKFLLILLSLFAGIQLPAGPPVPFSGKLAVDGTNFHGHALFSFSIVDGEGTVHWKHAEDANATIENFVMNGRYLVLLGGQGMQTLPADLFLQHESLFLRVSVDLKDGQGMRLLEPDQRITSSPYALSAEIARLAERAQVAGGVDAGAITADMLEQALLADLNRTFELGLISRDMLEQGVRDELNASITLDRLSAEVRADLNRTIGIANLSSEVTEKLNREFIIEPGSIGKSLLAQDVRDDLNRTITRESLSQDIIADLNRTVRLQDLSPEVSQSINRSITMSDLDSQVITELNNSITPGSILLNHLAQDVRDDLNRTITLSDLDSLVIAELNDTVATGSISLIQLSQGVRDELNATITRDRLSADVRADLNRTIGIANLSTEVTDKLNQTFSVDAGSITLDQLSQQVRDDINRTITRDRLSSDVLSDINRTITKSMLSQEVLDELNATGGITGSVPGSLIAVPANQSAPSGYELYQRGEPKELVWEEKASVSEGRWVYDGLEVLGDKIYFVGGLTSNGEFDTFNRYDPNSNSWQSIPSMPTTRGQHAVSSLEGKLYVIGGRTGTTIQSSVIIYDPIANIWSDGPSLPNGVRHACAITVSNKIYLIGGRNSSNTYLQQNIAFDTVSNQWTVLEPMPTARDAHKLVWYANRIWAIGGTNNGSDLSTVESYDPATNSWRTESSLSTPNRWVSAWVFDRSIYIAGGISGSTQLSSIHVYDRYTKLWNSLGSLPEPKFCADAVTLNDKVYVVSGQSGSNWSSKVFAADLNASAPIDLYYKTGDASSGTPTVQAEVADGSIGLSKLSSEVSNALKPVVVGQPSSVVGVDEQSVVLDVDVDGVNLSYQWKKNGVDIAGATGRTLSISDLNASQHEGNYTVVVSNAFGSVTSSAAQIDVNGSLTEGLVGWWKFDETEGNIASDSSGNGNDGNLTNDPTWTEGKIGGALSFDGVNDFVEVSSRKWTLNNSFSVSLWYFNQNLPTVNGTPFSLGRGYANDEILLFLGGAKIKSYIHKSSSNYAMRSESSSDSVWNHIVFSGSGGFAESQVNLFLNGSSTSSIYSTLGTPSLLSDDQNRTLRIGRRNTSDDYPYYHKGLIDDVRIYDRALSAVEVKALYELGEQPVQDSGAGTTMVVNGTVADGSIGLSKLSSEVSNALKPVVVGQPSSVVGVGGARTYLAVDVDGVNLSYQWKKDGVDIAGAAGSTLSIADLNASQHEGNYTVVASNAFGSVTSSVAQVDVNGSLTEGLVGWWKFDETEGDVAYDSSGNGNDGNLTNGPTWTEGKIGGALSFDGVNDYVQIPSMQSFFSNSSSFTTWVKILSYSLANEQGLAVFGTGQNLHYPFPGNSQLYINILRSVNRVPNILTTVNFFDWHHVSITTQNNGYWVMYHNSSQISRVDAEPLSLPNNKSFGRSVSDSSFRYLNGFLDDIRLYDRALSAVEVKALYELGEQPVQVSGAGTTTVVNGTVADGSITASKIADQTITTNQLSEQILKYLKPEITQQPTASPIFAGSNPTFSVSAEGKYLTYQWKKNGVNLTGETNATLTITDANATQHDGNYSVVVSNDFGSVESGEFELQISDALMNGLVGWWKFDGDANDSSLNGNNGVVYGATLTTDRFGNNNAAYSFDGTSHILISNDYGSTVSISLWTSTSHSNAKMVWCFGSQASGPDLFFANNKIFLNTWDSEENPFGGFSVESNKWYNFVTIISSGDTRQYVDGSLLGTATYRSPAGKDFYIAMKEDGQGDYAWEGSIDDVRVYNRKLTANEVQSIYQQEK